MSSSVVLCDDNEITFTVNSKLSEDNGRLIHNLFTLRDKQSYDIDLDSILNFISMIYEYHFDTPTIPQQFYLEKGLLQSDGYIQYYAVYIYSDKKLF